MSALEDLREHPLPEEPWRLDGPDARSFHEVVCDLARQVVLDPKSYSELPHEIVCALGVINDAVCDVARSLKRIR